MLLILKDVQVNTFVTPDTFIGFAQTLEGAVHVARTNMGERHLSPCPGISPTRIRYRVHEVTELGHQIGAEIARTTFSPDDELGDILWQIN